MGIPGRHADPEVIAEYKRLRLAGKNRATACRMTGLAYNTGMAHDPPGLPRPGAAAPPTSPTGDVPPEPPCESRVDERDEARGTRSIALVADRPIRTLEDAVAAAEVDLAEWRVERWETSAWTVPLKLRSESGDEVVRSQQFRVKLWLRRAVPKPLFDSLGALFDRLGARSPRFPAVARSVPKDPHLFEVDLFDVHFGKLCWGREAGVDYDLAIAERLYREAAAALLDKAAGYEIERVVLPIGNDFFHVDNGANTTTAGTPQDTDGRLAKILEAGEAAVVWAVEHLLRVAPVEVVWVPGNHDRLTSYCLARTIAAYFRHCGDVAVDCGPSPRKRVRYGTNLIGYTHGDAERPASLPAIMAQEWPSDWSETTTREWRLGHRHTQARHQTLPVLTADGVVIRWLGSLCPPDAWHHRKGYVGNRRVAEAYLMSRDRGYSGHFNHNAF